VALSEAEQVALVARLRDDFPYYAQSCLKIKTKTGDYTPAQRDFNVTWKGLRATVRDLEGVEQVVKLIRRYKGKR
jgi:hypothetical protein